MQKNNILITAFFIVMTVASCSDKTAAAMDLYLEGKKEFEAKNLDSAAEKFRSAVKKDRKLKNAWLMLGKCYYYKKEHDEAAKVFNNGLELNEDNVNLLLWKAKNMLAMDGSSIDEIISTLNSVVENDTFHTEARLMLALLHENRKDYRNSVLQYQFILNEQKIILDAKANLALLYLKTGLKDRSRRELEQTVAISKVLGIDSEKSQLLLKEITDTEESAK